MIKCKICGKEFENHYNSKTCSKECKKKNIRLNGNRNNKIWVKRHPEKRKETCREYSRKNAKWLNEKSREWARNNPKICIQRVYEWRKKNRDKRNAQARAQNNVPIPIGKLCEVCNIKLAVDRHHQDYSKPLEVIFLCSRCHKLEHLKKKEGLNGEQKVNQ